MTEQDRQDQVVEDEPGPDRYERLAAALERWQQDDPDGYAKFVQNMSGGVA